MCGKPKIVQQDPEGDARKAAEKATAEANAKRAGRRSANSTGSASSVLSPTEESGKKLTGFSGAFSTFLNDQKSKLGGG